MKGNIAFNDNYAVSEVVGGMILIVIAVVSFAAIYAYLIPHFEHVDENIKLQGYVTDNGTAAIMLEAGPSMSHWMAVATKVDGTPIGSKEYRSPTPIWNISECKFPLEDLGYAPLLDEDDMVHITIYNLYDDGSAQIVFDGTLHGKTKGPASTQPTSLPMLVSSLRTNTIDEDLICYNYTIKPSINALTYIYNWIVNGGPITNLLMPFDTNSPITVKDYSGNQNNGTASGPIWTNMGVVGGAYQFDGVNDYISLPYCFKSNFIDAITVEAWVKTASPSGVISSYNRNKYWELGAVNGKIQWSTTAVDGTKDTTSSSTVNDGNWHHVAATYDSSIGESAIYIDGKQDIKESGHNLGELLGTGDTPQGAIGTGPEAARTTVFSTSFETQDEKNKWKEDNETWGGGSQVETWANLKYDNFESGWGSYTAGSDASRSNTYKHEGSWSARIRSSSGANPPASSFSLTNGIDVDASAYTSLKIDFWWMWRGTGWTDSTDDWWLRYYNGTSWQTVSDIDYPSGFSKDTWYHQIVYINESNYRFPNNMKIRFQCDARDTNCVMYIDQVYINATTGGRTEYNFDLRNSSALTPRTGAYSIGGTGDFDPDYAYFNRTGIDTSGYKDVQLSVWYSYKSTSSTDKLDLYYKDGSNWVTIFEIQNPQIGDGNQLSWTNVKVQIPDNVDNLVLQFRWSTSATSKYVSIDDLEITGIPLGGGYNFSGIIDEFHIYNRALSAEQVYQNYLSTRYGYSDKSVIVSKETILGDIWKCIVTPNDIMGDDTPVESNTLQIVGYSGGE